MKHTHTASPRALVLLAASALSSAPLLAQEVTSAPPPVSATVPAPPVQTAPAPAPAPVFAPRQEVVQPLPVRPAPVVDAETDVAATPAPRATARKTARSATVTRSTSAARPAPVIASPESVPSVTPVPVPVSAAPVAVEPIPPVEHVAPAATVAKTSTVQTDTAPWMWIAGVVGALLVAIGALLLSRRRRVDDDEEVIESAYTTDPVVAPATSAFAERPWIRMTLEPTSTEQSASGTVMTYQLIVENEGPVDAHDVQISSFLLKDGKSSPLADSLIDPRALRGRIDVAAGRSVRVEASVVVADDREAKIVADARYPLPGGGEGHLAARFAVDAASVEMTTRVDDVLERV